MNTLYFAAAECDSMSWPRAAVLIAAAAAAAVIGWAIFR